MAPLPPLVRITSRSETARAIRWPRHLALFPIMLAPAHIGHLAMLRSLIRAAAAEGSFDSGLAADTPQSVEFFAKLKRALVHGYFVEEDPRSGKVESIAVPGYVFWPDDRNTGQAPAGFGLFRALESGYELWLAGLEFGRRGGGHG